MSVSKKGRRSIKYKNQTIIWWVGKNSDNEDKIWLHVVSDDKKIVFAYRIGEGDFFVVSKGCLFQGKKTSGCWERYWYPIKEPPMVVTPKFVLALIVWAVDGKCADKIRWR